METFSAFLIGFLVGCLVGLLARSYLSADSDNNAQMSVDVGALVQSQIQNQQLQNVMRSLQLDQARQEAEFRQLEENRVKYLAASQKPDYQQILGAVSRELERRGLSNAV